MLIDKLNFKSKKSRRRKGRGISAGQGKTAGRGTKGQRSRSGFSRKPAFEGGQTPLVHRLPKLKGFNKPHPSTQEVTLRQISRLKTTKIDTQTLFEANVIKSLRKPTKLIGDTKLTKKYSITVQRATPNAIKSVEAAGGSVTLRPFGKVKTKQTSK